MCAVLISLLVFLVHREIKAWVLKLAVKQHSQEVRRIFERIHVVTFRVEGVNEKLRNTALEILEIYKVGKLVKIKAALVLVLELFVVLMFFYPLFFCGLLLLSRHVGLLVHVVYGLD